MDIFFKSNKCDRCGKEASVFRMSIFNTDKLCCQCLRKEQRHPLYKKAHIERQNRYMAKKNPPVEKTCPICETVFTTTDSRKKYCSKSCSTKAQSLKLKGKNPKEKINDKELNRLQIANIIDIDFLPPDIETNNKMHRKMKIINTIDIDTLRHNMV